MKLSVLLDLIKDSGPTDWIKLDSYGHGYARGLFSVRANAEPQEYGRLVVYRNNLDVSLFITSVDQNEVYDIEEFEFADAVKDTLVVQLGYRGMPVYEWVFLLLEPDDVLIPMPVLVNGRLEFEGEELPYAMLIAQILGATTPDNFQVSKLRLWNVMAV
jgi:hypothetical protein